MTKNKKIPEWAKKVASLPEKEGMGAVLNMSDKDIGDLYKFTKNNQNGLSKKRDRSNSKIHS